MPMGKGEHETGQVRHSIPQWRQPEPHHIQAVIEVGAEAILENKRFEGLIRGRDDAHIDLHFQVRPDGAHCTALQHIQKLGLDMERKIIDVIQEERSALGGLEQAFAMGDGAGEGAFAVTK